MRGGDEAVHSHDAHMACVNQAVTHAFTTQCCMHIHCVQVACSVWTCKVPLVASRPPLIAWGFGHKGAKTYGLQQDGGDSDTRGGDEAIHSRGAHMACVTQTVTYVPSPCNAACTYGTRAGHMQGLDLRIDFDGISSTAHSVGLWAQGCKDLRPAARRRRQRHARWR